MQKRDYNKNILDAFRIIATIQVLAGHLVTHFGYDEALHIVYFLRGVPILFAMSGFLAAKSLEAYQPMVWLKGRFKRIVPGLYIAVVFNYIIILLLYEVAPTLIDGGVYFITQCLGLNFYTGDWLRGYGVGTPNGVLWTISVQIQFFLLAPLFHRLIKKQKPWQSLLMCGLMAAASVLFELLESTSHTMLFKLIRASVLPYLYFLVGGMVLWVHRESVLRFIGRYAMGMALLYLAVKLVESNTSVLSIFNGVHYNVLVTVLLVLVIFAFAFKWNWHMKNDLTFGFYLYHMIYVNIAIHLGAASMGVGIQALAIVGIILATALSAWASKRYLEPGLLALFGRLFGRRNANGGKTV